MENLDIEGKTEKLLRDFNITNPPVDIEKIVTSIGIKIKPYDFGEDVSGALLIDNEKSVIGYNPFEPLVRQRFTIAHEFGHFVLHLNESKSKFFVDQKILFRNQDSTSGQTKIERQANNFAAAILMPSFMINEELKKRGLKFIDEQTIKSLAEIFKVSQQAMTIRLINLDMLY